MAGHLANFSINGWHDPAIPSRSWAPTSMAWSIASRTPTCSNESTTSRRTLHQRGIGLGSRVVVQLPNVPGFVTLLLALLKIGAPPVLALAQHREHEIGDMLDRSGALAYAVGARSKAKTASQRRASSS